MEETKRVNVYETNYKCPRCLEGNMLLEHEVMPALAIYLDFSHRCNKCGFIKSLTDRYPKYTFKEARKRCQKKSSSAADISEDCPKTDSHS